MPDDIIEGSNLAHLKKRYKAYVKEVVKPFYEQHFRHFDRQIVLVDVLSALNEGSETEIIFTHGLTTIMAVATTMSTAMTVIMTVTTTVVMNIYGFYF